MKKEDDGFVLLTLADFASAVQVGAFTIDDGVGYFATSSGVSRERVPLEHIAQVKDSTSWTHVAWYGK